MKRARSPDQDKRPAKFNSPLEAQIASTMTNLDPIQFSFNPQASCELDPWAQARRRGDAWRKFSRTSYTTSTFCELPRQYRRAVFDELIEYLNKHNPSWGLAQFHQVWLAWRKQFKHVLLSLKNNSSAQASMSATSTSLSPRTTCAASLVDLASGAQPASPVLHVVASPVPVAEDAALD